MLKKLKDDLQKHKKALGNLTLKQLQANLDSAKARQKAINMQYDLKLEELSKLATAMSEVNHQIELSDLPPDDVQKSIGILKEFVKKKEVEVKGLVAQQNEQINLDVVRFRVGNPVFQDFVSPEISVAKDELERAATNDEIDAQKGALNKAIEDARQKAKAALAGMDQAAEQLKQYKPAQDLLEARAQKQQKLEQIKKEFQDLAKQAPTVKEFAAAANKVYDEEDKLGDLQRVAKEIPVLEASIAAIEPWFNALSKKDQAEQNQEQAKQDYNNAIAAKDTALDRAKAGLKAEQARIDQTKAGLQGQAKDQAYYQKLNQMTLQARATYELILLNLVDLDCFGDVRNFMNDLKQRMKKLDEARDQILKQASAAAKAATAKPTVVRGTFGRTGVVPGKLPPNVESSDFKLSGSMSVNTFSVTYEMKPPRNGRGTVSQTWKGTLKATLKPGDILELGCATKVTTSGVDAPNVAGSCGWTGEGSIEVLENAGCWAGVGTDGKLYPTCEGKFKFRVLPGQPGATVTIRAARGGQWWGNGDAGWIPVEVKYKFNP